MRAAALYFTRLLRSRKRRFCFLPTPHPPPSASYSLLSSYEILLDSSIAPAPPPPPTDAAEVFRRWGCTEAEASLVLERQPFIGRMCLDSLDAKLQVLCGVGILGSDLVRVVLCRPRVLAGRIGRDLQPRIAFLRTLLPSDADVRRAIIRNPSLINYDVDQTVRPCVRLYESVGISRRDLGRLILSRPTVIPRSSLDEEKLELLRRTPLSKESALYKYAVSVLAISRLETLHTKIANLESFGFSGDEVMALFARNPNVLTLSVEKVQRNMTYLIGTAKVPSSAVLLYPILLHCNLDRVLRPRHMLILRMEEMGLRPQMKETTLFVRAVRMKEERFLQVFVMCYPEEAAAKLMDYYSFLKGVRRLAESSRSTGKMAFPF